MADSSTPTGRIPVLFAEGCWARRPLCNGIEYVPTPSKTMKLLSALNEVPEGGIGEETRKPVYVTILFSPGDTCSR